MVGSMDMENKPSGSQDQKHEYDDSFYAQWSHTGQFRDYGASRAVCQLCGNTGLRYHFLIAHRNTGEAKWVGSQCILNFDLSAQMVQARKVQAKQQAKAEQDHQRLAAILREVQKVYRLVIEINQRKIRWVVGKFQRRGGFSPGDLAWLFQVMALLEFTPSFQCYPVRLQTKQDLEELRQIGVTGRRLIARCLSEEQRNVCEALGIRLNID